MLGEVNGDRCSSRSRPVAPTEGTAAPSGSQSASATSRRTRTSRSSGRRGSRRAFRSSRVGGVAAGGRTSSSRRRAARRASTKWWVLAPHSTWILAQVEQMPHPCRRSPRGDPRRRYAEVRAARRSPRRRAATRDGELRVAAGDPGRERAVRPRKGRFHRRRPAEVGRFEVAHRASLPRRDRRPAARGAGEAVACCRGSSRARLAEDDQGGRAAGRGHQPRPRRRGARGALPQRPSSPAERLPGRLPPLRERWEDIPLLVWHFISRRQATLGRGWSKPVPERLKAAPSPLRVGNVREWEERRGARAHHDVAGPRWRPTRGLPGRRRRWCCRWGPRRASPTRKADRGLDEGREASASTMPPTASASTASLSKFRMKKADSNGLPTVLDQRRDRVELGRCMSYYWNESWAGCPGTSETRPPRAADDGGPREVLRRTTRARLPFLQIHARA